MKIGLNATCFNNRPSGAKQRFIGIYKELFKYLNNDEFIVYEPSDCNISQWFKNPENVIFKKTPLMSDKRLQKYFVGLNYWPKIFKSEKFDVFEGFHLPLVSSPTGHTILTIHDIRGMVLNGSWRERIMYKVALEKSLKDANHVITVSESMKSEILEFYPQTPISVIYNGIDIESFQNISKLELLKVHETLNLPKEFLLAVGHFEKRKNYLSLIDALSKLHKDGRLISLVIVGNDSGEMSKVKEKVEALSLSNYVVFFNGLSDLEVRCIYNLCKLFVFPSSYEGFGIPILEAMASKRPIVLSSIPVFLEITEGQGAYFKYDDPDSMANVIEKVLSSQTEINRLVEYGSRRVYDFSFKKISIDLASIYKSLV